MNFAEKFCDDCGELIELLNCPHTHPRCLYRNSFLTGVFPFSHYPIPIQTEQKQSATGESVKPKVKKLPKPTEPAKSAESIDNQKFNDLTELFQRHISHQCRSKGRKRLVSALISTGTAADSSANESDADQVGTEGKKRQKSDRFWLKKTSAEHTNKKSLEEVATSESIDPSIKAKRPRMQINSTGKLMKFSSEFEAEMKDYQLLLAQTIIALETENLGKSMMSTADHCQTATEGIEYQLANPSAQNPTAGDIDAVLQANLPISSTDTHENSVQKQMELDQSGNVANETYLESVTVSNVSAKSDSSAEPNSPVSKAPTDTKDVDLAISKLADQFIGNFFFPSDQVHKIIDLMRNNLENTRVLIKCQQLIDRYQYGMFGASLTGSLIAIWLSVIKRHQNNSEMVEKFCRLLTWQRIANVWCCDRIDLYLEAIDILFDIGCGENKLTETAKMSTLSVLSLIIRKARKDNRNSIGKKAVKRFCQSIRDKLEKSDFDEIMLSRFSCLQSLCRRKSAANQKRFLSSKGLSLIQQIFKKRNGDKWFAQEMTSIMTRFMSCMMEELSKEKSILPDLMADGNPEILWQMWRDPSCREIWPLCRQIFTEFLSGSPPIWPFAYPTVEEVKNQLEVEQWSDPNGN